jgi:prepilin-type processing-associated H-X9-DG protein
MNYIVGLDFGTHQTKICIEDTTNVQPIYEFLEFTNSLNNTQSVILPSIVQINKDGRVSYGFVDTTKAMYFVDNSTKPTKAENRYPLMEGLLPEPKYIQKPKEPQREKQVGYLAILASLLLPSLQQARERAKSIDCMNKVKGIVFASLQYAENNRGYFSHGAGVPNSLYNMFSDLTPTIHSGGIANYLGVDRKFIRGGTNPWKNMAPPQAVCPSGGRYYGKPNDGSTSNQNFSYGLSNWYVASAGHLTSGMRPSSSDPNPPLSTLQRTRRPSTRFFCGDIGVDNILTLPSHSLRHAIALYSRERFSYRHSAKSSIGFLDGHVDQWGTAQVPLSPNAAYDPNENFREYDL